MNSADRILVLAAVMAFRLMLSFYKQFLAFNLSFFNESLDLLLSKDQCFRKLTVFFPVKLF